MIEAPQRMPTITMRTLRLLLVPSSPPPFGNREALGDSEATASGMTERTWLK
jgi:hypothetical protein